MFICYTTVENVSGETLENEENYNTAEHSANLHEDSILTVRRNLEILEEIGFDDDDPIELDSW